MKKQSISVERMTEVEKGFYLELLTNYGRGVADQFKRKIEAKRKEG